MELKLYADLCSDMTEDGSNRTFMELKSVLKHKELRFFFVLIVPLWN